MKNLKLSVILLITLIVVACSSDDDSQTSTITITVKDFETTINEHPVSEQELGTIEVTTNQGELVYSFKTEEPVNAFAIDNTGKLTVKDASLFDYEIRKTLEAIILVKNGELSKEVNVAVNLNDINDAIITVKDFETTIDEHPVSGQELGTIKATTDQGKLMYSFKTEEPVNAFTINNTGKLTVKDASLFDYETRKTLEAIILVKNGELSKEVNVAVNLNDINDAIITVKDFETTIDEHPVSGQELGTIKATTDQGKLMYSFKTEEPVNAFTINNTGKLTVKDASLFDYETRKTLRATLLIVATNEQETNNNEEVPSKEVTVIVNLNDITDDGIIIPDPNFRKALFEHTSPVIDTNRDGRISIAEAQVVKKINVERKDISDLSGIEYFTGLTELNCFGNNLKTLDIRKNTALTVLYCSRNRLSAIDVSKNTNLTVLYCNENLLSTIDVSKNVALTKLVCQENQLTALDLSKNTALIDLFSSFNRLTTLDLRYNTALTRIDLRNNKLLTSLNIKNGNNVALTYVDLRWNYSSNSYLSCVQVDDPTAAYLTNWKKDTRAFYSIDCRF
ncbi:cadherin repeat domain-containing protein [Aquimarina macrocephali]|uniref:cadherin repeat domain-containing protein n=1 Tax=Aquimarina macrocephali TaxID=666563 RepID=UPI0004667FEB|nr:cadherin repeat domain-containing protein [Aquimarina macrocephali]